MPFSSKITKRFSGRIEPGEKEDITETINYECTVEEVDIRFYPGPRNTLKIRPYRQNKGNQLDLIDSKPSQYIIGDDDYFEFDVSEQIKRRDTLGVEVINEGDHEYTYVVDITLDQQGGAQRAISALGGLFS